MEPIEHTTQQLHFPTSEPPTQDHAAPPTVALTVPVPSAPPAPPPQPPAARPTATRGRTTISDDVVGRVIQKIVDLAVERVDGVHGLHPGVDRFFGEEEPAEPERAVAVTLAEGEATINLAVEVDFGFPVHQVVDEVRGYVIGEVEQMLGLTVAEVNVAVGEVSLDP